MIKRFSKKLSVLAVLGALSGQMALAQYTIDLSSSSGAGINSTDVSLENIRVSVPVPNPFSPGTTTTNTATYNVTFRLDPVTLHLVPIQVGENAAGCAAVAVTVTNAVLGQNSPISGATVTISGQTATTNAQGVATFSGRPAGTVNISTVASNFVVTSQPAVLSCTTPNNVSVSLSPASGSGALTSGSFRVITTWGENPSDLDSHLTGPGGTTGRWHVYYGNPSDGDMCGLDVDDVTSYGPETMTCPRADVSALRPGVYRYSVHHFRGSGTIGSASANVRLELANGQYYNYTPPTGSYAGSADVWTVFELTVNTNGTVSVANVNSIQNSIYSDSVRSVAAPTAGSRESVQLFRNLTK